MLNLSILVDDGVFRYSSWPTFLLENHSLSYIELLVQFNKVANISSELEIVKGDHVLACLSSILTFLIFHYRILKIGAIVVPINILLKKTEVFYVHDHGDIKAAFCWDDPFTSLDNKIFCH